MIDAVITCMVQMLCTLLASLASFSMTLERRRQDSMVSNQADAWASCRPNYDRCHAIVCPVVFTMNQNINTSLFIHVTPPQCSQEMLRPIHIGNKCSVAAEWTGRQSVLTHRYLFRCLHDGQTTGCPPVALITARWCPCCPVVCPKYVYIGHCMYWLGMTKKPHVQTHMTHFYLCDASQHGYQLSSCVCPGPSVCVCLPSVHPSVASLRSVFY